MRLAYREVIKQAIHNVVIHAEEDPISVIRRGVAERVIEADRTNVEALIIEELRRLHEGVFARYGLRPSEVATWKARQGQR